MVGYCKGSLSVFAHELFKIWACAIEFVQRRGLEPVLGGSGKEGDVPLGWSFKLSDSWDREAVKCRSAFCTQSCPHFGCRQCYS